MTKLKFYKCVLCLLLFVCSTHSYLLAANTTEQLFTMSIKDKSIKEVLSLIESQSNFIFIYSSDILDKTGKVSFEAKNLTIEKLLDRLFLNSGIKYKINNRQIVLYKDQIPASKPTSSGKKKIAGTISDQNGFPVTGATIKVKNSSNGIISDLDGNFTLVVPDDAVIVVTYVGYLPQEISVEEKDYFDIRLVENEIAVQEVVVVGYGVQKKETVTGSLSSISTRDLVQSPQANISNSLAGRLPGLFAVQRSGEPGKDMSTIRIRGIGTFATSSDGTDPQDPLVLVDGIETSNYNEIDPSEIESFSILKDASATAVYGVRGANGVILITTRRGALGKPKISLSTNVAMTNFPFLRESMNSYEYATSFNKALAYDAYITGSYSPKFTDEEIEMYRTQADPVLYPSVNWYDYMLKDQSIQTRTNLNVRGGTENVKYFISLGYFTQQGLLNTAIYDPGYDYQVKYKRYNFRSNFDINVTKNLLASFDFSFQIGDLRNPNYSMGLLIDMLGSTPPVVSPGTIDNKIVVTPNPLGSTISPVDAFDKGWNRTYQNNLNGSVRLTYKMDYLLKGLSLRGVVSYKNFNSDKTTFSRNGVKYQLHDLESGRELIPTGATGNLSSSMTLAKDINVYAEAGIEYNRDFGGHHVTALALYNQSKHFSPSLEYLIPNGHQGLVGRITYAYENRYLAEFNVGYNGTENFAPGKRFGLFPAYSLGWVLTEEPFFPKNDYLVFAKVRGSYGTVGNDKIGGARFLYIPTTYGFYNNVYYPGEVGSTRHGELGSREGQIGNPDLTWERAEKMNLGIDMRFWKGKINLTFDWFKEKRDNILIKRNTVPAIIGISQEAMPAVNMGRMENGGFEGEFGYNDKIQEFHYFIKGNFTYAHNEIKYMDETPQKYTYLYKTGNRYGQYFGYVADGIFNTWEEVNDAKRPVYRQNNKIQPGDIRYRDINGDGYIDTDDMVPIGYSNFPEIIYGVTLGGEWKGFDFSVLFQGASRVSYSPSRRTKQGFFTNSGASKDLLNSWSYERYEQGLTSKYPRLAADNAGMNNALSTFWLEDASYLRLKNVEIGYTFRFRALKRIGVNSFRIYANGNNLITWCKLFPGEDPEFPNPEANNEPYPLTRVFNWGLNINF